MRTRLFLNSGSRQAEMRQEEVNTLFAKHKVEVESTELFDSIQELQIQVLAAINDGVEMIIAGGGDGTITASIEPMLGSDATLAILPLGTGNQFAKEIGIDSLESAVLAIKALRRARIDDAGGSGSCRRGCRPKHHAALCRRGSAGSRAWRDAACGWDHGRL